MRPQLATLLSIALLSIATLEVYLYLRVVGITVHSRQFSYSGEDHPNTLPMQPLDFVMMFAQNTVHMQMSSPTTAREWSLQYPRGGIVYLGPHKRPFMLAMFHQLQCLNILRLAILRVSSDLGGTSPHRNFSQQPEEIVWQARHCLNYLRQAALCQMDMRTEPVNSIQPRGSIWEQDFVCRDWSVVYDETEKNHREYDVWRNISHRTM